MDLSRFENPAGRLAHVGQGEAAYRAFVPNPLPPELPVDTGLIRTCSDASYALGELAAMGRTLPNPHLLISPFLRREAVLSSRIEGTQADIADLYAYEAEQPPLPGMLPPPTSDVQEVLNYVRALEYGLERVETLPVSKRLMLELHECLLRGVRGEHATPGEFRRSQNWIGRPGSTLADADFVPPPAPDMLDALDGLERYIHNEEAPHPPLMRLAFIHYQFEAIHPFIDGNGRIGRLLISLLTVNWKLLPLPLLYLSAYFERNRQTYYDLLMAVSTRSAWHDWVLFFLTGVAEQARDASDRAKRLQDLQMKWHQRLGRGRGSTRLISLADHLFASPIISIPQAARVLGLSYPAAGNNVEKLVQADILKPMRRRTYGKPYVAQDILDIIMPNRAEN